MGIGMPKFITDGYSNFKERCHDIREGFRLVKMVFRLTKGIDVSNSGDLRNPEVMVDALRKSEDLPESFQSMLSNVNNDDLKKMMQMATDMFTKKDGNKNEPYSMSETISKMANVWAEADRAKELEQHKETLDGIERAATEHAQYMNENRGSFNDCDKPEEPATTQSSESVFDKLDKSGLDRMVDAAMDQQDFTSEDSGVNQEASSSKVSQEESSLKDKEQSDDPEYIPSDTYKDILNLNKDFGGKESSSDIPGGSNFRTAREYQNSTKRTFQPDSSRAKTGPREKNLPPLTKMLGEELHKRFGANWRSKMPPYMTNPNTADIPDLGLGLGKDGNRDMILTMSKVLKDLY